MIGTVIQLVVIVVHPGVLKLSPGVIVWIIGALARLGRFLLVTVFRRKKSPATTRNYWSGGRAIAWHPRRRRTATGMVRWQGARSLLILNERRKKVNALVDLLQPYAVHIKVENVYSKNKNKCRVDRWKLKTHRTWVARRRRGGKSARRSAGRSAGMRARIAGRCDRWERRGDTAWSSRRHR